VCEGGFSSRTRPSVMFWNKAQPEIEKKPRADQKKGREVVLLKEGNCPREHQRGGGEGGGSGTQNLQGTSFGGSICTRKNPRNGAQRSRK